jgi:protease-4
MVSVAACEGRRRTGPAKDGAREEARSGPAVAILNFSDGLPEQAPAGILGLGGKGVSFDDFVREIERLGKETRETTDVRAVLVRLGATRLGLAQATEVGDALAQLGAKLPIWCHADDLGNATLYLAARACKRVLLSPGGSVDAIGLAAQTVYFRRLLVEELGLEVDFLQVGKYKGAEEPFTRDGPSPEARASLESTLAGLREAWLEGFGRARPSVAREALEDGPYAAATAKARGLVDEVAYFDEAREALERQSNAVRSESRLGAGQQAGGDELSDLLRALVGGSLGSAPIALVRATGAISMDGGTGLPGQSGGITERRLVRILTRLEKDEGVKAVVLRIDSPGGSALASDLIWHALMRVRNRKPLVVSVGGMAASGGYYLASSGSVVFADEASILGSIGVVGGKIAAKGALGKIGVHSETIPAKVGDRGAAVRAAYESLLEPWDEPTRARLLETMTGIYQLFLARVAEGRNLPVQRVAESAEGRIFGGREAKARGLIDEIGGLADAIARARTLAGLPDDARVAVATESSGLLETLAEDGTPAGALAAFVGAHSTAPDIVTAGAVAPDIVTAGAVAPDIITARAAAPDIVAQLAPYVESVMPIAGRERVLCALPFALTVR